MSSTRGVLYVRPDGECALAGDFFEPPPDHNNAGMPPAHTVTTGFI